MGSIESKRFKGIKKSSDGHLGLTVSVARPTHRHDASFLRRLVLSSLDEGKGRNVSLKLLRVIQFHWAEWIVRPMRSGEVEVGKILQLGEVPREAVAAKDQQTAAGVNRIRRRKPRFKMARVVEKMPTCGEGISVNLCPEPLFAYYVMHVLGMTLGSCDVLLPVAIGIVGLRAYRLDFDIGVFACTENDEVDTSAVRDNIRLIVQFSFECLIVQDSLTRSISAGIVAGFPSRQECAAPSNCAQSFLPPRSRDVEPVTIGLYRASTAAICVSIMPDL
jgi:hypothetical protein